MSRSHGTIKPAFWTGKTGRRLRGNAHAQALAAYLMTGPHTTMVGIFHLPMAYVINDLGMAPLDAAGATAALANDGFAERDPETDLVWVPNIARDQIGPNLAAGDRRRPAVMRLLEPHLKHPFGVAFVIRYHHPYILDRKGLIGEVNETERGFASSRKPPYPVPVPSPVPVPDPLDAYVSVWKRLTGRDDFSDGCGQYTGTERQWLVDVRKLTGGLAEFEARVSARLAEDKAGFLLKQTLLHWLAGPLRAPAVIPGAKRATGAAPAPSPDDYDETAVLE